MTMMRKNSWILTIALAILAVGLVVAFFFSGMDADDNGTGACFADNGTKSYTLMSPEQCQVARFACDEGQEYFADECGCGCKPSDSQNQTGGKLVPYYCTAESRQNEFCTKEYKPVCGWYDPAEVQCITYPCAITVGNQCEACQDPKILYYTEGECPAPGSPQA